MRIFDLPRMAAVIVSAFALAVLYVGYADTEEAKPDLVIKNLERWTNTSSPQPWVSLEVCNLGAAAVTGLPFRISANGRTQFFTLSMTLPPGRCSGHNAWQYIMWGMDTNQSYTVTVEADSRREVNESNEDNNILEATLASPFVGSEQIVSLTNSYITGITGPQGEIMRSAQINTDLPIIVYIRNSTNQPLSNKRVVLSSSRPSDIITGITNNGTTSNEGRADFYVKSNVAGTSVLRAMVDDQTIGSVFEVIFGAVPDTSSTPAAPAPENSRSNFKPDLVVKSITRLNIGNSTSPYISIELCNQGAVSLTGIPLRISANGHSSSFFLGTVLPIAGCLRHSWQYSMWGMDTNQSYAVTTVVDPDGQIVETNEDNNTLEAILVTPTLNETGSSQVVSPTTSFIDGLPGPQGDTIRSALVNVNLPIIVYIKDATNQPLANKQVVLSSSRPNYDQIINVSQNSNVTSSAGRADFYVKSSTPGISVLQASVDGRTLTRTFEVTFSTPPPPPELPDLIIESVTFSNTTLAPTVVVKNRGNSPATPVNFPVFFDWYDAQNRFITAVSSVNNRPDQVSLAPGETITFTGNSPADNAAKLKARVDPSNRIIESNEDNNTWEGTLTRPPPPPPTPPQDLPDLVVSSVTFNPTTRRPTINIHNQGTESAVANFFTDFSYLNAAGRHILNAGGAVNLPLPAEPLPAGATRTFHPSFSIPAEAVTLRIVIDRDNQVIESNENNNSRDVVLPAPAEPAPPPASSLPDLVIFGVTFNQTTRRPTVVIRNQGNAPAVANFFANFLYLNAAGQYTNTNVGGSVNLARPAPLPPGETRSFDAMFEVPADAVTVRIAIDRANQVVESDETNNTRDEAMPPPMREVPPDLTVESVTLPASGGARIVIKNVGGQTLTANFLTAVTYYNSAGILRTFSVRPATVRPIRPNTTRVLVSKRAIPRNATHFRVTVDSANQIAEASEINNALEGQIVIGNAR